MNHCLKTDILNSGDMLYFKMNSWARHQEISILGVIVPVMNSMTSFKTNIFFVGRYSLIFKMGTAAFPLQFCDDEWMRIAWCLVSAQ